MGDFHPPTRNHHKSKKYNQQHTLKRKHFMCPQRPLGAQSPVILQMPKEISDEVYDLRRMLLTPLFYGSSAVHSKMFLVTIISKKSMNLND